MENQEQVNHLNTNPAIQTEQVNGEQSIPAQAGKKNNFLTVLLSVLLLISCLIAGFFAYQTQKLAKELSEFKNQNPVTPNPEPESTFPMYTEPSLVPTENWKTYTNKELGFTIKYPDAWDVLSETKTQPFESSTLSITDGIYKLQFSTTQAGYGGIICKFDDSTGDEFAGPGRDEFGDSVDLAGGFGKELRRNKEAISKLSQYGYQRNSFDYSFRVCRAMDNLGTDGKKGYLGIFETKTGITGIVYYTPTNLDQNKLLLLDQILSTFKFTN